MTLYRNEHIQGLNISFCTLFPLSRTVLLAIRLIPGLGWGKCEVDVLFGRKKEKERYSEGPKSEITDVHLYAFLTYSPPYDKFGKIETKRITIPVGHKRLQNNK